jgi:hypothetical protein
MVWAIYILALFFPELLPTRPIVLFHGPKGAAKSTAGRAVMITIFGPKAQVVTFNPKKLDAIESAIVNNSIVVFDNIDGHHEHMQDILAVAATGGTLTARTLFTTMGGSDFQLDCFPIITSRNPKTFARDDVIDRLAYLQVERRKAFKRDSEIKKCVRENRPRFWRWLLDTLPDMLKALQTTKVGELYDDRMADFAGFAVAVGPVLGFPATEVRAALTAMSAEKLQFEAEHSPLMGALALYVDNRAKQLARFGDPDHDPKDHGRASQEVYDTMLASFSKKMTATELLDAVKSVKHDFSYTNAASFGQALHNHQPAIEAKFYFKLTENRKAKAGWYELGPIGGFQTWEQHEKAIKQAKKDEK